MKQFKTFNIDWFDFDTQTLIAKFYYSFDNEIHFVETINFACKWFVPRVDVDILDSLLFHLSIAIGISYYKLYPTSDIIVKSWNLDSYQKQFWHKFYKNWLWEFMFTNDINPKWLFNFVSQSDKIYQKQVFDTSRKALIPIWWGKDSLVSVELFRQTNIEFNLFTFGKSYDIHNAAVDIIQKPYLLITRKLDPLLFDMNKQWYYNGHVPITGIIAFVLQVVAYMYDYRYIIMSNESSANYANIFWWWMDINHQYSKSLEFEKDFDKYLSIYISDNIKYFSLLRGFFEIHIAKLFAKYEQYFSSFSSCNANFSINNVAWQRWCWLCPKCLFVYAILRPYLTHEQTLQIFGTEYYENPDLQDMFESLMWISWHKPFECVWTQDEVILSMYEQYQRLDSEKIPYILKVFEQKVLTWLDEKKIAELQKYLFSIQENIIPDEIKFQIKELN